MITFLATSAVFCLFGSNLVETARFRDLVASKEKIITPQSKLTPGLEQQIRLAFKIPTDISDIFEYAGPDKQFWVRTITHRISNSSYTMILSDPGDNIYGAFLMGNQVAAIVGDGDIGDCIVEYDAYDSLPWFYTN